MAGLLSVLLIMSIAFAAFQTNLTINGSSNINSNWCVGFDSSKTNTYVATAGLTGATAPTGQMAYSGNTCQTSYKTTATLKCIEGFIRYISQKVREVYYD